MFFPGLKVAYQAMSREHYAYDVLRRSELMYIYFRCSEWFVHYSR